MDFTQADPCEPSREERAGADARRIAEPANRATITTNNPEEILKISA
jgi:hypothetical protein